MKFEEPDEINMFHFINLTFRFHHMSLSTD